MYNLTNITNSSDFVSLAQHVNSDILNSSASSNPISLGLIMLVMIGGVVFFALLSRGERPSAAFAGTSFLVGLVATFLRALSLISDAQWFICLLSIAVAIAFLILDKGN